MNFLICQNIPNRKKAKICLTKVLIKHLFSIMKSGRSVPGHSRSDNTSNDKIKRSGSPDVPGLSAL